MALSWFRFFHGTSTDPKLGMAAQRAGVTRATMLGAWAWVLEFASQNDPRGSLEGLDEEVAGYALELDADAMRRILEAMRGRGLISADGIVCAWEKRQQASGGDRTNAERQRRFRERQRAAKAAEAARASAAGSDAQGAAPDEVGTPNNAVTGVTNADNALEERRGDKRRDSLSTGVERDSEADAAAGGKAVATLAEVRVAADLFNAAAKRAGLSAIAKLTDARRRAIAARLRDCDGLPGWEEALKKLEASRFLTGRVPGRDGSAPFRAGIDFLIREAAFCKLMEGGFDDRPPGGPRNAGSRDASGGAAVDAFAELADASRRDYPTSHRG